MESKSGVTRSIIEELQCLDSEGDQLEGKSGVTRRFSDELHS